MVEELDLVVSNVVLHEVEKNVRAKLNEIHLRRFFTLTRKVKIFDTILTDRELKGSQAVIVQKDAVILAQFKKSNCNFLITLDKRDFLQQQVFDFIVPKKIFTPKDFFAYFIFASLDNSLAKL